MKKNYVVAVIALLVTFMLVGCGSGTSVAKIEKLSDLEGRVVGLVDWGETQEVYQEYVKEEMGVKPKEIITYVKVSDALAAVLAGKIDAYFADSVVSDYYVKKNNAFKSFATKSKEKFNTAIGLRSDDQQLKAEFDKAIETMQEKGTLKRLQDEMIINAPVDGEPAAIEITRIAGAKTVRVGVSGSYGLIDYIGVDGRLSGFGANFLSEMGKLMNVNFEVVYLEDRVKYAASKRIDAIFIDLVHDNEEGSFNGINTKPYFAYYGSNAIVRK